LKRYKFFENALLGKPLKKEFQNIIGGGIAGLLLGFYLKQNNIPFKIYEKTDRLGGLLRSYWCEYGLIESSANGFLWNEEIQEICDVLGLDIMPPSKKSKARFLIRNKTFKRFPVGLKDMFKATYRLLRPSKEKPETIEDFGRVFFGEEMTRNVLEPALMGIYGAGVAELSFPAVLPSFAKSLNEGNAIGFGLWKRRWQKKKTVKKGAKKAATGTHCFENGMQDLIDALGEYLKDEIQLSTELETLPEDASVILCTPISVAQHYLNAGMNNYFQDLKYLSMLSCSVFVERSKIPKRKDGFGCLIPRTEGLDLLGILYNDCIFENRSRNKEVANLTCMFRDFNGDWKRKTDQEVQAIIEKELGILLGLKGPLLKVTVHRWEQGIPLHSPDLYQRRFAIDEKLIADNSNIRLFGNYTGQVSIRGMSEEAKKIAAAIG